MLRRKPRDTARRDPPPDAFVVGLGNPGADYDGTRHNVGFEVVDVLAGRHGGSWRESRRRALVCEIVVPGAGSPARVALAKPQTYMNESGGSVKACTAHYEVPPERLCVVHDDLDLDFAVLRLKQGGGTAGHQGLNSVARALGTKDFVRLRFGIGGPPGRMPAADYVLRRFKSDERTEVDVRVGEAADVVESWLAVGVEATQNRFH